jgi:hypothetical protein
VPACGQIRKEQRHIVVELALIGLERQQIIGVLVHNELRNSGLATDSVNRDQTAGQIKRPQQLRAGRDPVRLLSDLAQSRHDVIGGGPGADPINGAAAETVPRNTCQNVSCKGIPLGKFRKAAKRPDARKQDGAPTAASAPITTLLHTCRRRRSCVAWPA